jgi:hypothetical protein
LLTDIFEEIFMAAVRYGHMYFNSEADRDAWIARNGPLPGARSQTIADEQLQRAQDAERHRMIQQQFRTGTTHITTGYDPRSGMYGSGQQYRMVNGRMVPYYPLGGQPQPYGYGDPYAASYYRPRPVMLMPFGYNRGGLFGRNPLGNLLGGLGLGIGTGLIRSLTGPRTTTVVQPGATAYDEVPPDRRAPRAAN